MIDYPIDFVFPYVDCNREEWKKTYLDFCNSKGLYQRAKQLANERYRDFGYLKYVFRGIEKNLPFIRKVFFLVQSLDQVPQWLDTTKVQVVTHEQFMPSCALPSYNSSVIEMFLGNIPDLSEHFIYSNDDFYFLKPMKPEDFFDGDKVKIKFKIRPPKSGMFDLMCKSTYNFVLQNFSFVKGGEYSVSPCHELSPMIKSHIQFVFKRLEPQIMRSITHFRNERNYNQYLWSDYELVTNNTVDSPRTYKYMAMKNRPQEVADVIANKKFQILILNDTELTDTNIWFNDKTVKQAFNKILGNVSKYEKK